MLRRLNCVRLIVKHQRYTCEHFHVILNVQSHSVEIEGK